MRLNAMRKIHDEIISSYEPFRLFITLPCPCNALDRPKFVHRVAARTTMTRPLPRRTPSQTRVPKVGPACLDATRAALKRCSLVGVPMWGHCHHLLLKKAGRAVGAAKLQLDRRSPPDACYRELGGDAPR